MKIDYYIDLNNAKMNSFVRVVYDRYMELTENNGKSGVYSKYDWRRVSYAYDLVRPTGSILEVGFGSGQLINALAMSGNYSSVTGLDKKVHSKFVRLSDRYDICLESIDKMSFDDNTFDCVICMEVLEHIGLNTFIRGLRQLRRVCKGQLIMSVPYNEPLPLPSYHKQRFTDADIDKYFPEAKKHLLDKPNMPWILLEEYINPELYVE